MTKKQLYENQNKCCAICNYKLKLYKNMETIYNDKGESIMLIDKYCFEQINKFNHK